MLIILNMEIKKIVEDLIDNFLEAGISNVCFYGKKDIGKYTLARYLISNYYNNPCLLKECIFTSDGSPAPVTVPLNA